MIKLLLAEIRYRRLNFVLSLTAIAVAVALFVAGPMLVDSHGRETRAELERLDLGVAEAEALIVKSEAASAAELAQLEDQTRLVMRDLGFNLMIVHRDNDAIDFLATGLPTVDMPQEFVHQLAADPRLTMVTHLVAALRGQIDFDRRKVRLVGYLPETPQSHMRHETPMGYVVQPGTVLLGHHLAQGKTPGQSVEIGTRTFRIAQVLPEQGNEEDTSVVMHLSDAQTLLNCPGRVNLILALECRCAESALPAIRAQLGKILPQTQIIRDLSKAKARLRQRALVQEKHQRIVAYQKEALAERKLALAETATRRERVQNLMETLASIVTPLVVLASAVWVGLLALSNVRERRTEIGILRAMGKGSATIVLLFLGKAGLLGLLGAILGLILGVGLASAIGASFFGTAADHFSLHANAVWAGLLGAPLLSTVASYLPTLTALMQDPAAVLRDP